MPELSTIWSVLVDWLAHGLLRASSWQVLVTTLVMTHITIVAITVFLHRSQAHRSLDLHPIPAHFFRFWLWMSSGMVTKEWVAIHRKHHAKCETKDDPHSPVAHGIKTVLLRGSELYRAEAKVQETLKKFGHNTPDDWLERNVYTGHSKLGVSLMLVINVLLFGALGLTVWAVQMLWSPVHAAGIINGLGHWWGYRNFEAPDASTNIVPWGIWIGGEELHNNHHTFPTSAKLSVKPFEFDIGWGYIRVLEMLGLAKVRKTAPQLKLGAVRPVADSQTLEALIANRYEVMAQYATNLRKACADELERLKQQGAQNTERWTEMRLAQRWLHRDDQKIPADVKALVAKACDQSPSLTKLVTMREELRQLWTRTNVSGEQLVVDLQGWCQRAESSGIAALQDFARTLRSAHA
ncbi:fatty acid desaturase [Sphaerotilus sp.]|uniref:DesA family fatty acid desaturase n=1 Tax=Sphaerotilus sp. TaxID=2093942 RepID=UPI00286DA3EB|nr:fatty acid desaturase [Sphaerotilus sp.]